MKATNNAWYWLAAGVLALGLNGYYQDGGLPLLHRLAYGAQTRIAETKGQFSQVATLADVAMADHARLRCERSAPAPSAVVAVSTSVPPQVQARLADLQTRLGTLDTARIQARVERLQQVMARREMRRAQVELQNGRIAVITDQGQVQVALPPLPHVEVIVPPGPLVDVNDPN